MKQILYCRKQKGDCFNCMMADACPRYQDTDLNTPVIDEDLCVVGYDSPTSPDYDESGVKVV